MNRIFVTGTDTDIGKTWICGLLLSTLPSWRYWKPCQTGPLDMHDGPAISREWGIKPSRIVQMGYRLNEPASPHYAAALEEKECTLEALLEWSSTLDPASPYLIEGAGGSLVPLNSEQLLIELPIRMGWPILIIASTKLGGINHTLMTVESLMSRSANILGIVSIGEDDPSYRSAIRSHSLVRHLAHIPKCDSPFLPEALEHGQRLSTALLERLR